MVSKVTGAQWVSLTEFLTKFMQDRREPEVVASVPEGVPEHCVWTLVDDGECASLGNGRAVVNFMGYVVTDRPWEEDDMIGVDWDDNDRLLTFGGAYDRPYLFCAHDGIVRKRNDRSAQEHRITHDADTTEEGEGLIEMAGKYLLAVGEHLAVPDYVGPFANAEDACRYAEITHSGDAWSVVHIGAQNTAPPLAIVEGTAESAALTEFVQKVAALKIWGYDQDDGCPYDDTPEPPDGLLDSHSCLMGLIEDARRLAGGSSITTVPEQPSPAQVRRFLSLSIENGGLRLEDIAEFMQVIGQMAPQRFNELLVAHGVFTSNDAQLSYEDTLRILGRD